MKSKIFTPGNVFYLIETVLTTKKKKRIYSKVPRKEKNKYQL